LPKAGVSKPALGTAAAIVMTTPEAARRIRQEFPELADQLDRLIAQDCPALLYEPPPERESYGCD
jgi:hypothetical protein